MLRTTSTLSKRGFAWLCGPRPTVGLLSRSLSTAAAASDSASASHPSASDATDVSESRDAMRSSEDGALLRSLYASHFSLPPAQTQQPPSINAIFEVRPGSYLPVSATDVEAWLPEGVPASLDAEWAFARNSAWMTRDCSRLLSRLLDLHPANASLAATAAVNAALPPTLHSVIELPRLTDRAEWPQARLGVARAGVSLAWAANEASANVGVSASGSEALQRTAGPGSPLDDVVSRIGNVPDKILLTGNRGSGKTVALTQLVMRARRKGWVCVFVPNAWAHAHCGPFIEPVGGGLFDNPAMSKEVLRDLLAAHATALNGIPLSTCVNRSPVSDGAGLSPEWAKPFDLALRQFREEWARVQKVHGKRSLGFLATRSLVLGEDRNSQEDALDELFVRNFDPVTFSLESIGDLARLGLAVGDTLAGLAVQEVIRALRATTQVPVLLAVDGINEWVGSSVKDKSKATEKSTAVSAFRYENVPIAAIDLAVPRALSFLGRHKKHAESWGTVRNGFCVAATSHTHSDSIAGNDDFEDVLSSIPLRIRVPNYNQIEYLSAMSYYLNYAPIDPTLTYEEFLQYRMHTNSNAELLRKEAGSFFIPRTVRSNEAELRWAMISAVSEGDGEMEDVEEEEDADEENSDEDFEIADDDEEDDDDDEPIIREEHPDVLVDELEK